MIIFNRNDLNKTLKKRIKELQMESGDHDLALIVLGLLYIITKLDLSTSKKVNRLNKSVGSYFEIYAFTIYMIHRALLVKNLENKKIDIETVKDIFVHDIFFKNIYASPRFYVDLLIELGVECINHFCKTNSTKLQMYERINFYKSKDIGEDLKQDIFMHNYFASSGNKNVIHFSKELVGGAFDINSAVFFKIAFSNYLINSLGNFITIYVLNNYENYYNKNK